MNPNELRANCLKLITTHGRPYSMMDDTAFRNIVDPYLSAFPEKDKFTISATTMEDETMLEAEKVRQQITSDLKKIKIFSLKYDIASRLSQSFLGINAQYISNSKIQLRTLGVIKMENSHTGEYIKDLILKRLIKFEVSLNNVYTCTTDNGSNMLKSIEELQEEENILKRNKSSFSENETDSDDDSADDSENIENILSENILEGVRCAAHTHQLCIQDVMEKNLKATITKAREAVKILRTEKYVRILKQYSISKPCLDNKTRWNSKYNMLKFLVPAKTGCNDFSNSESTFRISERDWTLIAECLQALEPATIASLTFQNEQLLPGDFYGGWLRFKLQIQQQKSAFAKSLLFEVNKRENTLLDNDAFLAAIYLDPRWAPIMFRKPNNDDDNSYKQLYFEKTTKAIEQLKKIWIRISQTSETKMECENCEEFEEEQIETSQESSNDDVDVLDAYIQKITGDSSSNSKNNPDLIKIEQLLTEFSNVPIINRKADLLKWWEMKKMEMPELYSLALVANAVPMTQVSVERLFSSMKFIFSNLRANLRPNLLEDILMIRCNGLFEMEKKKTENN